MHLFWHAAENTYAAQLSYCTACDLHAARSYNKNPTLTKSLCTTVIQTWNNGAFGTGLKRQPHQKWHIAIDAADANWLLLLPFALAKWLLNGAPATLLVRKEFCSVVSRSQIQRMVTHCMFLSGTQKPTGSFFKRCFTFDHCTFITEKSFSGKYCSLFSHAHIKTSFCCASCSISQQNNHSHTFTSTPHCQANRYCCEAQQNLDTFTSEAHHHFLISTESASSFPLQPMSKM